MSYLRQTFFQDFQGSLSVCLSVRLEKSRSLRENFMDKAIVEYPVLHVALPQAVTASSRVEVAQELNRFGFG